jgi:site-specific DNA recombinase
MLSDQAAIAAAAQAIGLAENRLPSMFSMAEEWRQRLQSEVEAGAALTTLVQRVDLSDSGIRLALKVPMVDGGAQPIVNPTELTIRRDVPIQIKRRGVEMRLVIEGNRAPAPRVELALLKAVARAHHWSNELLSGRASSIAKVAEREGVSARYVRRLMRLAFLAPNIVEMIVAGRQRPDLTAEALAERIDLPLLWTAQEGAVGV